MHRCYLNERNQKFLLFCIMTIFAKLPPYLVMGRVNLDGERDFETEPTFGTFSNES